MCREGFVQVRLQLTVACLLPGAHWSGDPPVAYTPLAAPTLEHENLSIGIGSDFQSHAVITRTWQPERAC